MNRTLRCEHLARLSDPEIAALIALIPDPDVTVTSEPTTGMLMMRVVEDARGEQFNLGEVLVTECQVRVGDEEGWAMVLGSRPTAARLAATIDAALANDPSLAQSVDAQLADIISRHDASREADLAELAPTRVRFETQ